MAVLLYSWLHHISKPARTYQVCIYFVPVVHIEYIESESLDAVRAVARIVHTFVPGTSRIPGIAVAVA